MIVQSFQTYGRRFATRNGRVEAVNQQINMALEGSRVAFVTSLLKSCSTELFEAGLAHPNKYWVMSRQ